MADHQGCILAIIGSRDAPDYQSESLVKQAILEHQPKMVTSGGAKGVDKMATKVGQELGITVVEFVAGVPIWDTPERGQPTEVTTDYGMVVTINGGFKQRNEKIAQGCDCLVRIASHTTKTYGSGWTADRAEELGKSVVRHTV